MPSNDDRPGDMEQAAIPFTLDEDQGMQRLRPFVAPVASNSGAVAKDPSVRDMARAVYATFGDLDDGEGLTRGAIVAACGQNFPPGALESRLDLFVAMDVLVPVGAPDKPHQLRYSFNKMSAAGLLVYDRLAEAGGIQEITLLLSRTAEDIEDGTLDEAEVAERIAQARRALVINTGDLLRLVRSRTMEELLRERATRRSADGLLAEANSLVKLIVERFGQLAGAGQRLIRAAMNYCTAVDELWIRLLAYARTRRDFSMLSPEQYRTAAQRSTVDELAAVFARTVFDPPSVLISADQIVKTLDDLKPRPVRRRPPRPAETPSGDDPVERVKRRAAATIERRKAAAELHLQGRAEADLTGVVRGAGWPGAVRIVVDVILMAMEPSAPFTVDLSTALLVDARGPVSYTTPLRLSRSPADPAARDSVDAEIGLVEIKLESVKDVGDWDYDDTTR